MKTWLLALAVLAAPAAAEDSGGLALSVNGGASLPLGSTWVRDNGRLGPDLGAAVRFGLADGLDGAVSYDSVQMHKARAIRLEPVLFSLVHPFGPFGGWTPQARLGAGPVVVHEARLNGQAGSYTTYAVRLGAGFERPLCSRASAGLWADWLYAARSNAGTTDVQAALFGLSLSWRGGALTARAQAASPEPAPAASTAQAHPSLTPAPAPQTPAEVQEPPSDSE